MTAAELITRLETLAELSDGDAAGQLARSLSRAAALGAEASGPIDSAVVESMLASRREDALLPRLEPEALGALAERQAARLASASVGSGERTTAWKLLDLLRRDSFLARIPPDLVRPWSDRLLHLVERSHFTVGPLFRQRADRLGSKVLFEEQLEDGGRRALTWRQSAARVESLSCALLATGEPGPVAILSENRLQMALVDLACLTGGIVDVLVPANATEQDVAYILDHSGARTVIVSTAEQLRKVLASRDRLGALERIFTLDADAAGRDGVVALDAFAGGAAQVDPREARRRSEAVRIDDLATVMYTSGTTGMPKGICFSQRNVVFKRFARALALPRIGEQDIFLCYLPLFHTFGRFLEMLGCVFWGAKYCFLGRTSADALVEGMRRHRPTVFISVPKKWLELYERITQIADPLDASNERLADALRQVTGGNLRWGLSAAGHLDPEIFRFFQMHGVELLSGFGMTEATGGITMTPPGGYRDGSLGLPLPGIDVSLAEDGELLVRGPYVMTGYLEPPGGEPSFDAEGWLHTGDLMEADSAGHLRLIDRKKEIYKNLQGETIAPQRVENLFRDFDSVGRAFLVGDHRPYNTLLIWPDPANEEPDFSSLSRLEIADHFRSLVVSVNKFLAPYERVVDFAVIERDLDAERGELTAKGTPRRKVVERNFAETIQPLYRRTHLAVGDVQLTIPNWLFQILGLTARDILCDDERITLSSSGTSLTVKRASADHVRIGSSIYRHRRGPLNLGALLTTPRLWLGNEELVGFVPLDAVTRRRNDRTGAGLDWAGRVEPFHPSDEDRSTLSARAAHPGEMDLLDMDLPARMLGAEQDADALRAVGTLEAVLARDDHPMTETANMLLARMAGSPSARVRRTAFLVLLPYARPARFVELLRRFLRRDPALLDSETSVILSEQDLPDAKVAAFVEVTEQACLEPLAPAGLAESLLSFLAEYGAGHPVRFRRFRGLFERLTLFAARPAVRARAARASRRLLSGFRHWLGPNSRIAVDPETGREYRWEEVVVFEDDVVQADRQRILVAIKQTIFLREGVFLFSGGANVRLSDIPPGGVWIRLLGSRHGKSVYRLTVQTRFQGSYDLAVNVNHELSPADVRQELQWLILCGEQSDRGPLVEDFGGYWPEADLWSEEFIAGEPLSKAMRRLSRNNGTQERFRQLWPFLAWSTLAAYVDFWHRSGGRLEIADASMMNVVVPTEDFLSGVRLVSLSRRRPHRGLLSMMRAFRDEFVGEAERAYPVLAGVVGWELVFSSLLEIVGEREGLERFSAALGEDPPPSEGAAEVRAWTEAVAARGFMPLRLHFAVERYRRWSALSADATPQARALTLQELYDTYGLERLAPAYPALRVRFFRETVFQYAPAPLLAGLDALIERIRHGELPPDELLPAVDELRALEPDEEAEYFLARLSYPYLRPEDAAGFVRSDLGGQRQSEIVVNLEDEDGNLFRVRHALNPKEVERLHRLFLAAKLDVRFRMEHQYLVAINERSQIIGGIYYEIDEEGTSAHLEKIVVADAYRRRGVADGLMKEFFNRLRAAAVTTVTTGFFRPEYFYRFGFRIEKRYAGLVKSLGPEEPASS